MKIFINWARSSSCLIGRADKVGSYKVKEKILTLKYLKMLSL